MQKLLKPSPIQRAWRESHRCVICNGLPTTVSQEEVEEHRQLKDEFMYLARHGIPAEPWQTEHIGSMFRVTVVCENGHEFTAIHHQFRAIPDETEPQA